MSSKHDKKNSEHDEKNGKHDDKQNLKGIQWMFLGIVFFMLSVFLKSQWAAFEGSFFDMMSDYPEKNVTMLGSALRYALYGSALSSSILCFGRFAKGFVRQPR